MSSFPYFVMFCFLPSLGLMETLRELLERRVRRHLKGVEEKKGAIRNDRDTASTALMTILFSIEKRFNFTLEAMDVTATAYEAFKRELSVTKELFFSHFNSDFPLSGSDKILETNCVGMYFAESNRRQDLKWAQRELSAEEVDRAFIYNASKHLVLIEVKVTVERGELLS